MTSEQELRIWDFDPIAAHYDSLVVRESEHIYAHYDDLLNAVVEQAHILPGQRILEVGVGTGNLTRRILHQGAHVTGVDPSAAMLQIARKKLNAHSSIQLIQLCDPFLAGPFAPQTFDAVISSYAFHHIPHPEKTAALKTGLRWLKPGGIWICGDIAFKDQAAEDTSLERYDWLEEEYFTHLDSFKSICEELGAQFGLQSFNEYAHVFWARK